MDGTLVHELCNTFHIEKRRTSSYHSQGNGFAERCIRNIREILRTTLARHSAQKHWNKYLYGVIFTLNTSISRATKCVLFEVVFGRYSVLPEAIFLGKNDLHTLRDATSPAEYAEELKIILQEIYKEVQQQLGITREAMRKQYNKKIKVYDYKIGQSVWLKKKYYKTGESRKLSPRRTGPREIVEKMSNGVNFKIRNTIVHHDRLTHVKKSSMNTDESPTMNNGAIVSFESSSGEESDVTDVNYQEEPLSGFESRYQIRNRERRMIEVAIPSDAIDL